MLSITHCPESSGHPTDMMADAVATDAAEDEQFEPDGRHEDLAGEMARRETRLAKIRRAKADLEDDARRTAAADAARKAWHRGRTNKTKPPHDDDDGDETGTGPRPGPGPSGLNDGDDHGSSEPTPAGDDGPSREEQVHQAADDAATTATPEAKAQRNFTDPDARIMKTSDGSFHYCYNTQTVADGASQVIVATGSRTSQQTATSSPR